MTHALKLCKQMLNDYRVNWKTLVLTDFGYKIIVFILLGSLLGIAFRLSLYFSGREILADEDIPYFFMEPAGWVCTILVGALWIGLAAFEQGALLAVLRGSSKEHQVGCLEALQFAFGHVLPVLGVSTRMVSTFLLLVAPLLLLAGAIYQTLLTRYDINYYLAEQPGEFVYAVSAGIIIAFSILIIMLRLACNWFFVLPLVLFEQLKGAAALSASKRRAAGQRFSLLLWIIIWLLVSLLLSALVTTLIIALGHWIVPRSMGSMPLLAASVGFTLLLWLTGNFIVNLVSTVAFAVLLFNIYRFNGQGAAVFSVVAGTQADYSTGTSFLFGYRRLVITVMALIVVSVALGYLAIGSIDLPDRVEVIAHRGASASAPENTIAAIRKAIADQADWVEIDVQETADGEVVVFHDSDFMKIAGRDLKIWDATAADLARIDVGSHFDPEFQNERVPPLREVLNECKGKIRVLIELKHYGHDQQLGSRVAGIVESADMQSEIAFMSLDFEQISHMKQLRPEWTSGLLTSAALGDIGNADVDFLAVNTGLASYRFVKKAHAAGKKVYVWTVNDAPTMSAMISRGVDGLITDDPVLARTVLQQRAGLPPMVRILSQLAGYLGVEPAPEAS